MAAKRVHLVRHAAPTARSDVDPAKWPLSKSGRTAAGRLAPSLPPAAFLLSSTEVKAIETLTLASGSRPVADERFCEVRRPGEPFDDDVISRRRAWVEACLDERHAGWETPGQAAARFADGVHAYPHHDLVVATHGMVMTAWLVSIGALLEGTPAAERWAALQFPDLVVVTV